MDEFEKLYITTKDKHLKNITRIVHGNLQIAEDIFHNAVVRALNYYPTYDKEKGPINNWFSRILYNELSRYFRKEKKFYAENLEDWENTEQCINYDTVLDQLLSINTNPTNNDDISCNDALRLVYLHGYSNKEVSRILNINEGSVRQICLRFKKEVKEK